MKRKKVSNSARFEVFKRDKFTCQFCGRKAPDIVLQVDHLHPVSKGGAGDILNLITSCVECNSGKSDRTLSDSAVLDKTRQQLAELEERRQQLEMMVRWRESLSGANETLVASVERQFSQASGGYTINASGLTTIRRLVKEFGYEEVSEAVAIAADQYFRWVNGVVTKESVEQAFKKLVGICKGRRLEKTNPEEAELYYALNIWKKAAGSQSSLDNSRAMNAIRAAHARGVPIKIIKQVCGSSPWLTRLEQELEATATK